MRFTKMEGLGNDYVYLNGFEVEAGAAGTELLDLLARDLQYLTPEAHNQAATLAAEVSRLLTAFRRKVEEAVDYPILKVKLGTDRDEEILSTICDAASPDTVLRVDANAVPHLEVVAVGFRLFLGNLFNDRVHDGRGSEESKSGRR